MSNILTGYLAREIFKTSAATVLVLYIIFISNALGRELADIADGDVPQQALWAVMLSQSVNILSMLLPIGIFCSIIYNIEVAVFYHFLALDSDQHFSRKGSCE